MSLEGLLSAVMQACSVDEREATRIVAQWINSDEEKKQDTLRFYGL